MGGVLSDLVSRINIIETALKSKHSADYSSAKLILEINNSTAPTTVPPDFVQTGDTWTFTVKEHALYLSNIRRLVVSQNNEILRIQHNGVSYVSLNPDQLGYANGAVLVKPGDVIRCTGYYNNPFMNVKAMLLETIL